MTFQDKVKFYKSPDMIFIRCIQTSKDRDFSTGKDRYLSVARFSLGYKT